GTKIKLIQKENVSGKEIEVVKELNVNDDFFKTLTKPKTVDAKLGGVTNAMVAASKDRLIVNPFLSNCNKDTVYFYQL
ncbi:hypothetical protein SB748_36990, partial [Rhizobium sp. SIMBA_035]